MKNLSLKICLAIAALFGSVGSGFASDLPPCNGMSMWSGHNCVGSFIFNDGNKYVGEFKDSKIHGQGTEIFADGGKYVGEFRDNNYHGQGTFTYASGNKYVGELRNNKRNGQGTYTFANGNKYVGEFKDDKFNGQGTYTFADGTVKEGIWKDWQFQYAQKLSPPVPVAKTPTQDDEIISASSGSGFSQCKKEETYRNCSDPQICSLATANGIVWDFRVKFKRAIHEAKRRKITCGIQEVTETNSRVRPEFIKLPKNEREKIQKNLQNMLYYNSTIDGLFGIETLKAIEGFNKHYMGNPPICGAVRN